MQHLRNLLANDKLRLLFRVLNAFPDLYDNPELPNHLVELKARAGSDTPRLIDLAAESRFWKNTFSFAKPLRQDRNLPRVVFF